ncbi:hypothetical protein DASB73_000420 [Starmerella bacillaris]|uniref:Defect at low temperature protein 1 n=1 Tax=Starmerella bacillaris TaxID=1247836 RepID=A0AAV5RER6_STABA|nr:hypothetical protein DASB73_000420 [Starmerella bacillaris]
MQLEPQTSKSAESLAAGKDTILRWIPNGINYYLRWRQKSSKIRVVSRTLSAFWLVVTNLLIACTFIDILRQSFYSGQFWNSIIVICVLGIVVLWACSLHFARLLHLNRRMRLIPRHNLLTEFDLGKKMTTKIASTRLRCEMLFKTQMNFAAVEHPGLQNPQDKNLIEGPYWELSDIIPQFLEDHFTTTDLEFSIPPNCSLHEYITLALAKNKIDPYAHTAAHRFVELYDEFRYGGHNVSREFLLEIMECLKVIVSSIRESNTAWYQRENSISSFQDSVLIYDDQSSRSSSSDSIRSRISRVSRGSRGSGLSGLSGLTRASGLSRLSIHSRITTNSRRSSHGASHLSEISPHTSWRH